MRLVDEPDPRPQETGNNQEILVLSLKSHDSLAALSPSIAVDVLGMI